LHKALGSIPSTEEKEKVNSKLWGRGEKRRCPKDWEMGQYLQGALNMAEHSPGTVALRYRLYAQESL
jgi:hypothetical protein